MKCLQGVNVKNVFSFLKTLPILQSNHNDLIYIKKRGRGTHSVIHAIRSGMDLVHR